MTTKMSIKQAILWLSVLLILDYASGSLISSYREWSMRWVQKMRTYWKGINECKSFDNIQSYISADPPQPSAHKPAIWERDGNSYPPYCERCQPGVSEFCVQLKMKKQMIYQGNGTEPRPCVEEHLRAREKYAWCRTLRGQYYNSTSLTILSVFSVIHIITWRSSGYWWPCASTFVVQLAREVRRVEVKRKEVNSD